MPPPELSANPVPLDNIVNVLPSVEKTVCVPFTLVGLVPVYPLMVTVLPAVILCAELVATSKEIVDPTTVLIDYARVALPVGRWSSSADAGDAPPLEFQSCEIVLLLDPNDTKLADLPTPAVALSYV